MSRLFSPWTLRSITFRNRVFVSPMCQYSSVEGLPTPWHLVHLGSRAVGGAGLVMMEATAITADGRITLTDQGLWNDQQRDALQPIAAFIEEQGAIPGIQLAHAGRKASVNVPWAGGGPLAPDQSAWPTKAPSPIPFGPEYPAPRAFTHSDIKILIEAFTAATIRAAHAGFRVLELHMAHGYLLHEFLSPLSNKRTDTYGGSLENRMRLPLAITEAVRAAWPKENPLFVRISASDWVDNGWDIHQSVILARALKSSGVDLIDCSSGGLVPYAKIIAGPGYQTPFATRIRDEVGIATGAVGLITEALQAEQIIATGLADCVFLGRQLLRDPYWPLHAAQSLHTSVEWPIQYERAKQ